MSRYLPLQIVIPIYNDWDSVSQLLPQLAAQLADCGREADVLIADDQSTEPPPPTWPDDSPGIRQVRVLRLSRNLGHQRAICVALCHLRDQPECEQILVMDGDGEDAAEDGPKLLQALEQDTSLSIVFAERQKRFESWVFLMSYAVYRALHRILVGHRVRVGNFSVMRRPCLESLCRSWELWNHYAAAVFALRQPMGFLPTPRARRIAGRSRMNFSALVTHGLSALAVFSDRISARLLIFSCGAIAASAAGTLVSAGIWMTTEQAWAGWAAGGLGLLSLLLVQIVIFMLTFSFVILFSRGQSPFIPMRDYHPFIIHVQDSGDDG